MARIRTIKPEFWTAEQIMECSPIARLLFIGMWNFCDDGGNHPASCKTLKAEVFPGDDISSSQVQVLVDELVSNGLVSAYEAGDRRYWHVTGWHHQRIDQPSYKHPAPDGTTPKGAPKRRPDSGGSQPAPRAEPKTSNPPVESSATDSGVFAECSPNVRRTFEECSPPEGKGMEGKGKEMSISSPSPIASPKAESTPPGIPNRARETYPPITLAPRGSSAKRPPLADHRPPAPGQQAPPLPGTAEKNFSKSGTLAEAALAEIRGVARHSGP